jgi:hypothetical protein
MVSATTNDQTAADEIDGTDNTPVSRFDAALFGPPPLLAGDDPNQYTQLFRGISATVRPADIFERSSVRHMADLMWEVRRYRRIATQLVDANDQQGLEKVLRPLVQTDRMNELFFGTTKSQDLAQGYALKQQTAVAEVKGLLEAAGLDWDAVKAEAVALRVTEIERFNRLVMTAAARVNSTLRELERRRADLAKRLRRAVQQAEAEDVGRVDTGQVGANEVEANQVDSNQVDSNQVEANQVEANQVEVSQGEADQTNDSSDWKLAA